MSFLDNTSKDGFAVTPSDTVDLPVAAQALLIRVAGDVKIRTPRGTVITYPMPAGYNPVEAYRVYATGTTATGIFGLLK
jgi:hypothetical protein